MAITVKPIVQSTIPNDDAREALGYITTGPYNLGSEIELSGGGVLLGRADEDDGPAEEIALGASLVISDGALIVNFASTTEIRAKNNAKALTMGGALAAAAWVDLGNLTGAVALNFANWLQAKAVLTGNVTFNAPTNLPDGVYVLHVTHSGAARTIALNASNWDTPGGAGLTLSTTAGLSDLLTIIKKPGGKALISAVLNVGA